MSAVLDGNSEIQVINHKAIVDKWPRWCAIQLPGAVVEFKTWRVGKHLGLQEDFLVTTLPETSENTYPALVEGILQPLPRSF